MDNLFSWMWVKFPNTCMEPVGSSPKNSNSKQIPSQKKGITRPCLEYVSAILGPFFLVPGFWGSSPLQNLQVTIAHSKDGAIRPDLPTQGGLLGDLGSKGEFFGWRKWQFFASGWAASSMKISLPGVICILFGAISHEFHEMFGHFGGITSTLCRKSRKLTWNLKRMVSKRESPFPLFSGSMLLFGGVPCTILWRIRHRRVTDRSDWIWTFESRVKKSNPSAVLGWNMGRYLRYPPWN